MTITPIPIPAPRTTDRVRPAIPEDSCTLDGPCGVCATLTPAARAALAEGLTAEISPAPAVDAYAFVMRLAIRGAHRWASAPLTDSRGRGYMAGAEAALRNLVEAAPDGVPTDVMTEARAALDEGGLA